jgi:cob(I)alamin adenosyltransferase
VKLYTKAGDNGGTSLFDGTKVRKDDLRVEAYGTVDELNADLGLAANVLSIKTGQPGWDALVERVRHIQLELFTMGAELATPMEARQRNKVPEISAEQVVRLEGWIDEATAVVTELRSFVLPGGDAAAAQLHVCRTVCRRAERRVVTMAEGAAVNPQVIIYLNRLSDLLFAWARLANHLAGVPDVIWTNPRK